MAIEGRSEKKEGPIRYGMVGGGEGAFIGAVHRLAARMDDEFELVAGALSSSAERAKSSAAAIGLDPERSYGSFTEMAKAEAKRPDGMRDSAAARLSGSLKSCWRDSVITVVGAMALTRMFLSAHSIASIRVIWMRPAFEMP